MLPARVSWRMSGCRLVTLGGGRQGAGRAYDGLMVCGVASHVCTAAVVAVRGDTPTPSSTNPTQQHSTRSREQLIHRCPQQGLISSSIHPGQLPSFLQLTAQA